ncbi:helix-turn-helix domain-containing protein [Streptomyces sp. DSM 44915]|uniref:Helix-turn-helix domain-containing protein n=1 Tax=Streptomyces chisholmiae TaxID=3075540 RepID=A0ABU2JX36_9ACTN|nr:helix-turn-helix domain-containing protein [Streptomyces sp. DSM 44915]MDT0269560.1 helix-turn-helix domain-containing protein [Streptomyces sp. DSM 44915]
MPEFIADCPARLALDVLGNTWHGVLLWALRDGPSRPAELRRPFGGISNKALTEALRRLERDGLVARRRYREAPPRVEYRLTPLGRGLLPALRAAGDWAATHGAEVLAAQDAWAQRADGPGNSQTGTRQGSAVAPPADR